MPGYRNASQMPEERGPGPAARMSRGGTVCRYCGGSGYAAGGEVGRKDDPKWFDKDHEHSLENGRAVDRYSTGRGGEEDEASSSSFMKYLMQRRAARRRLASGGI